MTYRERMKNLREDHDLKQQEVAELLQTTQSYYSKYENGVRPLPIIHLATLAKYYNVTADYILGLTNDPRQIR